MTLKLTKSKIEWCDYVWNPVWGCYHSCIYCYARKIAKRFHENIYSKECKYFNEMDQERRDEEWIFMAYETMLEDFFPTFILSNFDKKMPDKPARLFVNSMSDIIFWEYPWFDRVIEKIKKYPQHTFIFLTKNIDVYRKNWFPENCWLGVSITDQKDMDRVFKEYSCSRNLQSMNNLFFASLEPLHSEINLYNIFNWVIVGAESGNRKGKIIPKKSWILKILTYCQCKGPPMMKPKLFMKSNLKSILGFKLTQEIPDKKTS